MEFLSATLNYPLAVIPFATSIVLVMGSPEAVPAQPRALIGGHLVATLIGLMVVHAVGAQPWAAALAVGLAVLAMFLTGTFHPPAGINPLLVVSLNLPWTFIVAPVLAGALLLAAFAFVWASRGPASALAGALALDRRHPLTFTERELLAGANQRHLALVESLKRFAMSDRDDRGLRELFHDQPIEQLF